LRSTPKCEILAEFFDGVALLGHKKQICSWGDEFLPQFREAFVARRSSAMRFSS